MSPGARTKPVGMVRGSSTKVPPLSALSELSQTPKLSSPNDHGILVAVGIPIGQQIEFGQAIGPEALARTELGLGTAGEEQRSERA